MSAIQLELIPHQTIVGWARSTNDSISFSTYMALAHPCILEEVVGVGWAKIQLVISVVRVLSLPTLPETDFALRYSLKRLGYSLICQPMTLQRVVRHEF